jgi:hypothetical protein
MKTAKTLGDRISAAWFTPTVDLEVRVEVHETPHLPMTRAKVLRTCESLIWGAMARPARDLWPARPAAKPKSRQPTLRLLARVDPS